MIACKNNSVVINKKKIKCNSRHEVDIVMEKRNISIIKGTVYNEDGDLAVGAAIEVREVDCVSKEKIILGYSFTDCKGEYAFSIEPKCNKFYELNIYSPLLN